MVKLLGKSREIEAKDAISKLSDKLSSEKVLPVKEQVSRTYFISYYFRVLKVLKFMIRFLNDTFKMGISFSEII